MTMYNRPEMSHLPLRLRLAGYADVMGLSRIMMSLRGQAPWRDLTVVQYHRVAAPEDVGLGDTDLVDATPETFAAHLSFFRRCFEPVTLTEVREARAGGKPLPPNALLVTFDDGYLDNYVRATPILRRFGMSGVFFVATDYLDARRLFWWDRIAVMIKRATVPRLKIEYPQTEEWSLTDARSRAQALRGAVRLVKDTFGMDLELFLEGLATACGLSWSKEEEAAAARALIMTWDEVRGLSDAGMEVQSHTRSHRVLATVPDAELSDELLGARVDIEGKLGKVCDTIAYPVGRAIADKARLRTAVAAAGYKLGFTTRSGTNPSDESLDPFDWHRFRIDGDMPVAVVRGMTAVPWLGT